MKRVIFLLLTAFVQVGLCVSCGKKIRGHEYVDLGLSVKWATCNVGASYPEDYGDYFAWGETETKSGYYDEDCETWGKQIGDIKGTRRDVAHVKWGSSWRMPTKAEFIELLNSDNCTWTWTTSNGVDGYIVTSKKNDNSIFLPAVGYRNGTSLDDAGEYGSYWSSTPYRGATRIVYALHFYRDNGDGYLKQGWGWSSRGFGRSIRPVSE